MTEMVDRVARAMLRAAGDNPDLLDCTFETFRHLARAAIEAMREPGDMVIEAAMIGACRSGNLISHNDAEVAWQAGIDEALK